MGVRVGVGVRKLLGRHLAVARGECHVDGLDGALVIVDRTHGPHDRVPGEG